MLRVLTDVANCNVRSQTAPSCCDCTPTNGLEFADRHLETILADCTLEPSINEHFKVDRPVGVVVV